MKTHTVTHYLGRSLSDTELAAFAGGVTEGGCIPDPMQEALKKLLSGKEAQELLKKFGKE